MTSAVAGRGILPLKSVDSSLTVLLLRRATSTSFDVCLSRNPSSAPRLRYTTVARRRGMPPTPTALPRVALNFVLASVAAAGVAEEHATAVAKPTPRRTLCGGGNIDFATDGVSWCEALNGVGIGEDTVVFYDIVIGLPTVLFVMFLGSHLRNSVRKLTHTGDRRVVLLFAFLWMSCIFNLVRWGVRLWQPSPEHKAAIWNALCIAIRFGTTFLELVVLAILAHEPEGYLPDPVGARLGKTNKFASPLGAALAVTGLDALVKSLVVYAGGVALFVHAPGRFFSQAGSGSLEGSGVEWTKWVYWCARSAVFASAYLFILAAKNSQFRNILPGADAYARKTINKYALFMGTTHVLCALGAFLLSVDFAIGTCAFGVGSFAYDAGVPPVLYVSFLRNYFRENEFELDGEQYAEMRDAGMFDGDWDDEEGR